MLGTKQALIHLKKIVDPQSKPAENAKTYIILKLCKQIKRLKVYI